LTTSPDRLTLASASVAAALPTLPHGSCRALKVWIGASRYRLRSPTHATESSDNHQMDEQELTHWLDALAAAGLIGDWQWDLDVLPGEPTGVQYWIDGRPYTHDGAVKLVRDFEAARVL